MVDPDLTTVSGIPPHFWKRQGDLIVEMTPQEKQVRLVRIKYFGTDCNVEDYIYPGQKDRSLKRYKALLISSLLFSAIVLAFGVYALYS